MFGLDPKTIEYIKEVFKRHPEIETAKIYGSRAMGNFKYNSDVDLALLGDFSWDLTGHIHEELDSLPTPYLFDITDYKRINENALKEHIDKFGAVFYKK